MPDYEEKDHQIPEWGEAEAVDPLDARIIGQGSFSSSLGPKDLERLRWITKSIHMRNYPTEMITNAEADRIIDAMGPQTREYLIRKHIFKEDAVKGY